MTITYCESRYPIVRNRYLRFYMCGYDALTALFASRRRVEGRPVRRLLLRNPAALGDVLYTLRLVRAIKASNPEIQIGLLIGSWAKAMVAECRDVDFIHVEDHWMVNRHEISRLAKICHWLDTRRAALRDIRAAHYDAAVDCYYYFPGTSLLYRAGIPVRVGYDSREGRHLLTRVLHFANEDIHNVEYQARLVQALGLPLGDLPQAVVNFAYQQSDAAVLAAHQLMAGKYIIVSVGTGEPRREWLVERWQELLDRLDAAGHTVVLVGAGKREAERIARFMSGKHRHRVSLCNQLSILELAQIIHHARLFIGLESFAGHLAAMFQTPQVSIMHGQTNQYQWQPYANPYCEVLRVPLPCLTCYFPSACTHDNACMNHSVDSVMAAVERALSRTHVPSVATKVGQQPASPTTGGGRPPKYVP